MNITKIKVPTMSMEHILMLHLITKTPYQYQQYHIIVVT